MTRTRLAALCLALAALCAGAIAAACAGAEASRSGSGGDRAFPPASEGAIGVSGAEADLARVRLELAAGSVSAAVMLTTEEAPALYPQLLVVRADPVLPLTSRATLTLPYGDELVRAWGIDDETQLGVFQRDGDGTWWWTPALVDAATNTVVMQVDALGAWTVGPSWMMKPWQQRSILGAAFGRGERNALIIHGWNSEPWDGCQLSLAAGIAPYYDNVAAVAYPSAFDIAENGVWLRGEIERQWPDTPFDIIAFSEGGLAARAAIEPHAWNGGTRIGAEIGRLVTIATPHQGIDPAAPLSVLNDEAALQMRPGSGFLRELNDGPRHDGVRYQLIAGDLGNGTDSIVPRESALGGGLLRAERTTVLPLAHSPSGVAPRGMPCDALVYETVGGWSFGVGR
ncbi:MAG: hypothetical protein HY873_07620 [Chloroflexi bacterium]|nr:hypothetical protein [Chloroflexota bacterium]